MHQFLSDEADDQFSPTTGEQDTWENEPEWTGFSGDETVSTSEDDVDMADEPSPAKPVTREKPKAKSKKPLTIRDLVKTQIRVDSQSNTPNSKKRKLTGDSNR